MPPKVERPAFMSIGADSMLVIFYEIGFGQHGYCCKLGSLIFLNEINHWYQNHKTYTTVAN